MEHTKTEKDQQYKSLTELLEVTAYRIWLTNMGLHETYDIIMAGSDFIYGWILLNHATWNVAFTIGLIWDTSNTIC